LPKVIEGKNQFGIIVAANLAPDVERHLIGLECAGVVSQPGAGQSQLIGGGGCLGRTREILGGDLQTPFCHRSCIGFAAEPDQDFYLIPESIDVCFALRTPGSQRNLNLPGDVSQCACIDHSGFNLPANQFAEGIDNLNRVAGVFSLRLAESFASLGDGLDSGLG